MNWREQPRGERVIVALDTDEATAVRLSEQLTGVVRWVKVGMTLFDAAGPRVVDRFRSAGFDVFLDLKLHDIPHQVRGAAAALHELGAGMLTVHALGGSAMIESAKAGAGDQTAVIAVTVLTSLGDDDVHALGFGDDASAALVERLARLSASAGADGVVCSPQEAAGVRALLGADALVVTPGIRSPRGGADDQVRVAGVREAFDAGASHIVIGRPVTGADSPAEAAARIVEEAG